MDKDYISILGDELASLYGSSGQDRETGAMGGNSQLGTYSNKLFGAPYQLLDSVDGRFPAINSETGNEYLRNFLLHSPILFIKPGMPKYTGGDGGSSVFKAIRNAYGADSTLQSMLTDIAGGTLLSGGSKLQKRMFGFRETYMEYMNYVNYMCRSISSFMNLNSGGDLPGGAFTSGGGYESFGNIRWENYRMTDRYVNKVWEQARDIANATVFGATGRTIGATGKTIGGLINSINPLSPDFLDGDVLSSVTDEMFNTIDDAWGDSRDKRVYDVMANKITSFQIMVEPVSFSESLDNVTEPSMLESAIDGLSSIGSELAFITNSGAQPDILSGFTEFLGNGMDTAAMAVEGLVEKTTGGFLGNLFSGAIQSIKGQKMIYPEIYKSSTSRMDYEFSVNLTSPYGDKYNYYMNIVVPLCHLIALVAPRMVTSNTISSPFLVQAYIPGMCTCQLGIISHMTIDKNPNRNHVSVDGYPLTVRVTFTVKELYNAMAISPIHDPASFMFNETLNDYLANMAGLLPSMDSYHTIRDSIFDNMSNYFTDGTYLDDGMSGFLEGVEDMFTPRY